MPASYLGVDIAKLTLELSALPKLKTNQCTNDSKTINRLVGQLQKLPDQPIHVICEATGGYEQPLLQALHAAGIPVSCLNPAFVRHFAKGRGQRAKTDRLDAELLADYGRTYEPKPTPPPEPVQQQLAALVTRREQLKNLVQEERNRQEHQHDPFVIKEAASLLRLLQKHLERVEKQMQSLVAAHPALQQSVTRLSQIQGVGPLTATILLATMPELGKMERGQPAALAGVAPDNEDSGPVSKPRKISAGRSLARMALYMAALAASRHNPVLKPVYQRLRARGLPPKKALVALMRKLIELANLILKNPNLSLAA